MKNLGLILVLLGLASDVGAFFLSKTASQTSLTLAYAGFGVGVVLIIVGFVLWQKGGAKAPVTTQP